MVIASEIGMGIVLTAVLAAAGAILGARECNRFAIHTSSSRGSRPSSRLPRHGGRPWGPWRSHPMRCVAILAAVVAFGAFAGVAAVEAETPEGCRNQCSFDLEACKKACIDSRDFDGCLNDCRYDDENCLSGCR